jgi:hypothetical protein
MPTYGQANGGKFNFYTQYAIPTGNVANNAAAFVNALATSTAGTTCSIVFSNTDPLLSTTSKDITSSITIPKPNSGSVSYDNTTHTLQMTGVTPTPTLPTCTTTGLYYLVFGSAPAFIHQSTFSALPGTSDLFTMALSNTYTPGVIGSAPSNTVVLASNVTFVNDGIMQIVCSDFSSTTMIPVTVTLTNNTITGSDILNPTATVDSTNNLVTISSTTAMGTPSAILCPGGYRVVVGSSPAFIYN